MKANESKNKMARLKLLTKKERERREQKKQIIFAIIVAIIMVASVIGFTLELSYREQPNPYEHTIELYGRKITINTLYSKNETGDVVLDFIPSVDYFAGKRFYFYSSPELRQSAVRLLQYLNYFTLLNEACLNESNAAYKCYNEELPLKSCDDDVVVFAYSNASKIEKQKGCIILSGNETTIEKTIDRFLYELFSL
jgi:hypothetical protein